MKRKQKNVILGVLTAVFCLGASACDLSHKHFVDSYGYCNNCQEDQAIDLVQKNGSYVAEPSDQNTYNEVFFRFVGNGEQGVKIAVTCVGTGVSSVIFFSEKDDYIASKYDTENPQIASAEPLEKGVTYYVRVKLTQNGKVGLTVTPWDGEMEETIN